ncbi:hypothetical protein PENDEC_c046G04432 [Penicillium decumbens]|uniref:Uncharacterized protein n=1 Tax=Penicillium decumbens TaxID=69771 RepID=A0A1V6NRA0_PENDC|nr:hypothetical protein PENDEC_c046G04432 [Penicillium decumbens]
MADHSSPNYKDLYLKAEEGRKQEAEGRRQEAEGRRQAEEREKQAEERTRQTTFTELIQHCHVLLSRSLKVDSPSRSTTGQIPLPKGKYCPTRLEHWTDCQKQLSEVYNSEQELEAYERFGVEEHVHDVITKLCKLPAAREEFGLGDGIQFSNHKNSLNENEPMEVEANQLPITSQPRPNQFCINRVDGNSTTVLTTVEYKPPHKLPSTTLRMGLRPMDLWKDMSDSSAPPLFKNTT